MSVIGEIKLTYTQMVGNDNIDTENWNTRQFDQRRIKLREDIASGNLSTDDEIAAGEEVRAITRILNNSGVLKNTAEKEKSARKKEQDQKLLTALENMKVAMTNWDLTKTPGKTRTGG